MLSKHDISELAVVGPDLGEFAPQNLGVVAARHCVSAGHGLASATEAHIYAQRSDLDDVSMSRTSEGPAEQTKFLRLRPALALF